MICSVTAMPRSAPIRAASSSSIDSPVSRGERVTMRLISCVSLLCVLARPALNRWNRFIVGGRERGSSTIGRRRIFPGRLEPFDVRVRDPDGADERFTLAEAVAIGTAGDQQVVLFGDGKITFRHDGGMLGVKTFNAVEAGGNQVRDDVIRAVQSRMRHDGEAAGLV